MSILALYDIDGTILLTHGAGTRALNAAFRELYDAENAMAGVSCAGKTDPLIVGEAFRQVHKRNPSESETQQVIECYEGLLPGQIASTQYEVLPAVHESLELMRKHGATIGLATGNTENGARIKLERAKLWREFAFGGYGSDRGDRGELVQCAIERGNEAAGRSFAKNEIWVIGDTERDVAAARACGVKVAAVATGSKSRDELAKCEPDLLMESLEELNALF